ncbi:MAG: response regulator [Acidimicrobiales bacterium]
MSSSGPSEAEIRVVVCDDHALFRRGLVMALDDTDDIEVVAEAADGTGAVETALAVAPDVVLMDVHMPGIDGIEAARRLAQAIPTARVLMLAVSDDGDDLFEALKAGAVGYLLKELSLPEIAEAVRAVAYGDSFVSPAMARKLIAEFAAISREADHPRGSLSGPRLTARELEVLRAMAEGADNRAMAAALAMTENTVRNHVRNILEKLQLHTRAEAVMYAVRERLVDP